MIHTNCKEIFIRKLSILVFIAAVVIAIVSVNIDLAINRHAVNGTTIPAPNPTVAYLWPLPLPIIGLIVSGKMTLESSRYWKSLPILAILINLLAIAYVVFWYGLSSHLTF